ncbi:MULTISPECIES: hypothetical protein [unclassified Paenibacillus]|uniref:hypothetical protein n=1 Tax=unclassified Paenibacillus TaxID=185978 RepID=UPI001AE8EFE9|nr:MULTISPECIES: hypothetical protein [unclassified Paenibacillus]MBP1153618.1 succinate dehydrogenase/fumarate reductase flavoprotein subunit [Paenibacillus sp. PvP091]MBP1170997.1 succinate dehydrogenase/fumarate reductase flavoprotein subunit [Paenibacillus sp. PvR098]MBP2442025.1 succinate dehydrogenase/fumarate reductase flavoprotein subunit [Paenibacillus sp. PvP052]
MANLRYKRDLKEQVIEKLRDLRKRLQKAANRHLLIIRNEQGLFTFKEELNEMEHLLFNEVNI